MRTKQELAVRVAQAARAIPDIQATEAVLANVVLVAMEGYEFVSSEELAALRSRLALADKMAGAAHYLAGRSYVGGGMPRHAAEVKCLDAVKAYRA